jgi:hypothetical protein
VPGERISPNAIVRSSSTTKVPFGETFGVPSGRLSLRTRGAAPR